MIFGHERERRSRYNRTHSYIFKTFEPWSTVPIPPSVEEITGLPESSALGKYFQTPRPIRQWRPAQSYKITDAMALPGQVPTSAMMDPCYIPYGMATEPLKFPNLVTGLERNAAHAARAALYTRYTPLEWAKTNLERYEEADINKNYSERLRDQFDKAMRETEEKTNQGQREAGRRLGERITDITFWRNEVRTELERLLTETSLLNDIRLATKKALDDIEGPLHIAQECLYHREKREGVDLVHDNVEHALLNEVESYRDAKEKLRDMLNKIQDQLRNNRASQHELECDVKSKESALGVDTLCHQLNNYSKGINYYKGIETFDNTISVPETWAENSNRIVQRSQSERGKSAQLRSDAEHLINAVAQKVWDSWSNTNTGLARRAAETLEAKSRLQMHLHKIQQEIFDLERHMEFLKRALIAKGNPMKVAHTRLEARSRRKDIELCRDNAQIKLVNEVYELQDSIETLHRKLREAETQHQRLLKTRSNLEAELHNKVNSLFIDREKCMGMRRSFPIASTVKY
ncbi:hypothetical protein NQ315_001432 [Exocentrus adspersus]|uniref:Tektin n=1 Tax=Exocentrus adspersus TaxID=1586481 RepID=A0AAV8WGH2_9CUCU|nr:hypothetical protein NQ315_001432 [Exocentrus adspersus]